MMGGMGFPEILMLAILSGGSSSTDVIATFGSLSHNTLSSTTPTVFSAKFSTP